MKDYANLQQNAVNLVCVFVDCTDEYILYHKVPEFVTELRKIGDSITIGVNENCIFDFTRIFYEISDLNLAAIQMIDSWGKIPSGILDGNLKAWGRSDLCLKTEISIIQDVINTDF